VRVTTGILPPPVAPPVRAWRQVLRGIASLKESRVGMIGAGIILAWILVAIFAPLLAPYAPNQPIKPMQPIGAMAPGGGTFWLGTDHLGRDIRASSRHADGADLCRWRPSPPMPSVS
jgi:peptide/nickel transport system permease protein